MCRRNAASGEQDKDHGKVTLPVIAKSVWTALAGGGWSALPHRGGVHGIETAVRGRGKPVSDRPQGLAGAGIHAAGGELAAGDAGAADFALGRAGFVFERVQRKQTLRCNEQCG